MGYLPISSNLADAVCASEQVLRAADTLGLPQTRVVRMTTSVRPFLTISRGLRRPVYDGRRWFLVRFYDYDFRFAD